MAGVSDPTNTAANSSTVGQQYNVQNDPLYQQTLQSGQNAFNTARAGALFNLNQQTAALQNQQTAMKQNATDAQRQLAGNFAARGMQRGGYGAYYRAQDRANAQQIVAQTDIKDQISMLNQNFLTNYGAIGTDWLGTAAGQNYQNQALQLALQNRLAQAGVNG